jgi:hypothetical protein
MLPPKIWLIILKYSNVETAHKLYNILPISLITMEIKEYIYKEVPLIELINIGEIDLAINRFLTTDNFADIYYIWEYLDDISKDYVKNKYIGRIYGISGIICAMGFNNIADAFKKFTINELDELPNNNPVSRVGIICDCIKNNQIDIAYLLLNNLPPIHENHILKIIKNCHNLDIWQIFKDQLTGPLKTFMRQGHLSFLYREDNVSIVFFIRDFIKYWPDKKSYIKLSNRQEYSIMKTLLL